MWIMNDHGSWHIMAMLVRRNSTPQLSTFDCEMPSWYALHVHPFHCARWQKVGAQENPLQPCVAMDKDESLVGDECAAAVDWHLMVIICNYLDILSFDILHQACSYFSIHWSSASRKAVHMECREVMNRSIYAWPSIWYHTLVLWLSLHSTHLTRLK